LIFTSLGKYFFFNSKTGERCWIPPETILKMIKEKFFTSKFEMFFDPFHQEGEFEEFEEFDEDSGSFESDNVTDNDIVNDTLTLTTQKSQDDLIEDEFKLYLLKNSVDPFAPWPTILSLHSSSPQFQAIPSDKRRQQIFSQVCPILIEQKREDNKKKLAEAEKWWDEVKSEYLKLGWQWFQVIKKVKGNSKFSLLKEKDCEKEYKKLFNKGL
jgi:hypothetical protein